MDREDLVCATGRRWGVCLADGRRAADLRSAVQPAIPGGLFRRGQQAALWRGEHATESETWEEGPDRFRVRTQRGEQPVHDVRAVARLAARQGYGTTDTA